MTKTGQSPTISQSVAHAPVKSIVLYATVSLLLLFSWMSKAISVPNERTRVYLSISLIDAQSLSIDYAVKKFGKTNDIAKYKKHYYTDKAPGTGFLGAAVYGAVRLFSPADAWPIERIIRLLRTFVMIPCGLIGLFLLRRWLVSMRIDSVSVDLASLAWILGTSAFHYSTAFYGHQLAAVGFLAALYLSSSTRSGLGLSAAGAATGFAGLMEYQSAVPAVICLFYVVWRHRALKPIFFYILGATPFALLLLGYNWAAFDSPFDLSYQHLLLKRAQALHSDGIGGVSYPKAVSTFGSLLSLHRGLITTSPIFVMIPLGLMQLWRQKERALTVAMSAIVIFYLWFVFSADLWFGGWSFGPRLLVPMMPFGAVCVAVAFDRLRHTPWGWGLMLGLAIAGILYHQAVHVVFPELPDGARNPMPDVILPAIKKGILSPNLVSDVVGDYPIAALLGLVFLVCVALFIVVVPSFRQRSLLSRLQLLFGMVLPTLILTLAISVTPPSWNSKKKKRFLKWMQNMAQKDRIAAVEKR